jgi:NAD(P)-dependent dehydrogenase (short-subunit alcohol dehydrogenase family)
MTDKDKEIPKQRLAVVSGASSGIGAATARRLAAEGYHVLAGVRRSKDADALRAINLEPIILDITDEAAIAELVQRIRADPGHRPLGALVNNAGMAVNAPLEAYKLEEWRRLFDVNLFGHVAMMQALLPALIESRGTIVNISSVGGKVAMATYGPYAGTKFALEAISDSLRREVAPLGVKVVLIEPGAVTTGMLEQVGDRGEKVMEAMTTAQRVRYGNLMHAVVAQAEASIASGASPEEAARIITSAITSSRPRTRYTVGRGTGMIVRLTRLVSDRTLDHILAANLRPHFPKAVPA